MKRLLTRPKDQVPAPAPDPTQARRTTTTCIDTVHVSGGRVNVTRSDGEVVSVSVFTDFGGNAARIGWYGSRQFSAKDVARTLREAADVIDEVCR